LLAILGLPKPERMTGESLILPAGATPLATSPVPHTLRV
jgi:hypothetical protein